MAPGALTAASSLLVLFAVSNVYGCALLVAAFASRRELLLSPRFSLSRFYLLMGWAPLTFAALALAVDLRYLVLFLVAGPAGIAGELIVAAAWRRFFRVPIWTYNFRAVLAGHTSTLNFLPWAMGALLLHSTARLVGLPNDADVLRPASIGGMVLLLSFLVAWGLRGRTSAAEGGFSKPAFAVFVSPIACTAAALTVTVGPRILLAMPVFAVVGFATEYAYGRGMSLFFERGLWTYHHWRIDEGHSSFVTFPLWALGGVYFHFLAASLGL